jgi:hypothetical protein
VKDALFIFVILFAMGFIVACSKTNAPQIEGGHIFDGKPGTWDPTWQGYSCATPDHTAPKPVAKKKHVKLVCDSKAGCIYVPTDAIIRKNVLVDKKKAVSK